MPASALNFRPAYADERARAASLCTAAPIRPGDGPQQCFVAVKEHPVERLVGAAFYREVSANGPLIEFEWSMIGGLVGDEAEQEFLLALAHYIESECESAAIMEATSWFPIEHPSAKTLVEVHYHPHRSRLQLGGQVEAWEECLKEEPELPPGHHLVRPEPDHFEEIKDLICTPSHWLRTSELAHGFHTAWGSEPSLFDPRCSALLMVDGVPVAACLANLHADCLAIAVLHADASTIGPLVGLVMKGGALIGDASKVVAVLGKEEMAPLGDRFPSQPGLPVWRYRFTPSRRID